MQVSKDVENLLEEHVDEQDRLDRLERRTRVLGPLLVLPGDSGSGSARSSDDTTSWILFAVRGSCWVAS